MTSLPPVRTQRRFRVEPGPRRDVRVRCGALGAVGWELRFFYRRQHTFVWIRGHTAGPLTDALST